MGLPRQRDIRAVGIDALVDLGEGGQVAKVNGAAFAEIATEKGVELVKQLLAEVVPLFDAPVYFFQQRPLPGLEVLTLHAHQVDEAGIALHLSPGEQRFQRV